ncbi:P-loop containing nucleoside triphosphate hydrolase protein [Hypoxylon argillaceum]|nr:P-loop containing nucleoside triphosphate hydrolase protein [Hypoxylon argillaceum]
MGITPEDGGNVSAPTRAFARDTLSIEIEGPSCPPLTLVDIPGLIHTSTLGISDEDVKLVADITDHYISQPRTICLAVVSAANDIANQTILTKVRQVDPHGDRTLGIITKPDILDPDSSSQSKAIELAQNENVYLGLGWHVIRNSKSKKSNSPLLDRNYAETMFSRTSNFKSLPKESVGVGALRTRLSELLYGHVRRELPKLGHDLEAALHETQKDLELLGVPRPNSTEECNAYLMQLSFDYYNLCKAAVLGDYEDGFFHLSSDVDFSSQSSTAVVRLRALVQLMHTNFTETFDKRGKKYQISQPDDDVSTQYTSTESSDVGLTKLSWENAIEWVREVRVRTRGRESVGNVNPLLIAELFWEQSSGWKALADNHVEEILQACENFLRILLNSETKYVTHTYYAL